jgi:demethylspheroidene O-methyltransferase
MLFDLPPVAERAERNFAEAGLGGRARAYGGDFAADALPAGADLITLVRVLHDHDDAKAQAILAKVRGALAPGGRLLLAEPMAGTSGAEPIGAAYFGFYLLAMGSGRARRLEEITAMLREAGFARVSPIATRQPMLTSLLVAEA